MEKKLTATNLLLGFQHLFAMFGATVLVPIITGLNPSMALIGAGLGTLLFHFITGHKVPVFLGSSFAFLGVVGATIAGDPANIPLAQGGIMAAGVVYILLAALVRLIGSERIVKLFPPVVTGPIIVVIGLTLAPVALTNAGLIVPQGTSIDWVTVGVALFSLTVVIVCTIFLKGFFKLVPILLGFASGYFLCLILDFTIGTHFVDFTAITNAAWINIPYVTPNFFTLPKFDLGVIFSIAPVAIVTFMEHIGDITINGSVVGKNFFKDPGLHRTVLGDGLATLLAGFIGAPPNTTYGENTAVLATTKNYSTFVLKLAAVFAIILGLFGKFGAIIMTIPTPVLGGVSILLYGMISSIGMRTLAESNLDFSHSRNLIIVALILVIGLGLSGGVAITPNITLTGLFLAVVVGAAVNKILPEHI
ncbi:uracil permease [Hydrogenoanaerobacterium saccharovorans]|uniref:Uracil permease n=1 Tax=Hydrogenoanaerobacterium saccharovorans TaxID=474960 RepID=A0A1H7YR96_9FIRM|nr:solute carrier family 23 protein [Hydrogenoanaerobacterium saccharovorans]RPF49070.1 uracil permease [Hydrogenoanaerobacterium saccharovorans]SEM48495.1 uracil permease [Hydrogenoanaerobacterium saccharovorans]